MNLLGNSIKFCESGSVRLTITPSPPGTLDLKDGEIAIRAEVTDTGTPRSQLPFPHPNF
jgi:signal transduction histidine kinase